MVFVMVVNDIVAIIVVIDFNAKRDENLFLPNYGKSILTVNRPTNS